MQIITGVINVKNIKARRKVRNLMFIAANNDMSATAHQIVKLCEWRGESAYKPNQANNFNAE